MRVHGPRKLVCAIYPQCGGGLTMGRKATGGVEVHGNTLRVYFQYQGKRCREVLTDVPPTLKNKAAAQKDLVTMLEKIKHGVLTTLNTFPIPRSL